MTPLLREQVLSMRSKQRKFPVTLANRLAYYVTEATANLRDNCINLKLLTEGSSCRRGLGRRKNLWRKLYGSHVMFSIQDRISIRRISFSLLLGITNSYTNLVKEVALLTYRRYTNTPERVRPHRCSFAVAVRAASRAAIHLTEVVFW